MNISTKKTVFIGKRGGYSIPTKFLTSPQGVKQEYLYKEYWDSKAEFTLKVWEGK